MMKLSTRSSSLDQLEALFYNTLLIDNFVPLALVAQDSTECVANLLFYQMIGMPSQSSLRWMPLSRLPFAENREFLSLLHELKSRTKTAVEFTTHVRTLDDSLKVIRLKMAGITDGEYFTGVAMTLHDVSHFYKKEDLLKARVKDLTQKNLEQQRLIDTSFQVENFACIAAHDLREPLRTIGNFTRLLRDRCNKHLDLIAQEYLDYIQHGVASMDSLINDIMAYARLENHDHLMQEVNLSDLLFLLEKDFEQELNRLNASLTVEVSSKKLVANREKLKTLFAHLVGNAIKFRKATGKLSINIREIENEHWWQFSVSDNGMGIPPEFHEKIFLLFKRLHGKNNYEGNGAGLAICKKIIEQHGGKIWVESEPGKGAAFHFTIAKPHDWLELNRP